MSNDNMEDYQVCVNFMVSFIINCNQRGIPTERGNERLYTYLAELRRRGASTKFVNRLVTRASSRVKLGVENWGRRKH